MTGFLRLLLFCCVNLSLLLTDGGSKNLLLGLAFAVVGLLSSLLLEGENVNAGAHADDAVEEYDEEDAVDAVEVIEDKDDADGDRCFILTQVCNRRLMCVFQLLLLLLLLLLCTLSATNTNRVR